MWSRRWTPIKQLISGQTAGADGGVYGIQSFNKGKGNHEENLAWVAISSLVSLCS